ncbi:MAG: stage III sporulation protein AF [Velocimicrobium sp.]
MELIMDTVKNLAVYMIFATVIKNLIGNRSYAKYIEFFLGLIMILIVVAPMGHLLNINGNLESYLKSNQINFEIKESKNDLYEGEKVVNDAIIETASTQLKEQIIELAKEEEIYVKQCEISLSKEEDTFGEIIELEIWLSYDEKQIAIQKVTLKKDEDDKGRFPDFVKQIADTYGIDETIIFIHEC